MERNVKGITSKFDNPLDVYFASSASAKKAAETSKNQRNEKRNAYIELTTANVNSSVHVDSENPATAHEVNTAASSIEDTAIDNNTGIIEISPATVKSAQETIILPAELIPEMSLLDDYTNYIKGIQNRMKKDLMKICVALFDIRAKKLYESAGYKNVVEYAMAELGYSRDTVNKYISVAELFIEKTGEGYKSIFVDAGEKDFTVGALIELLPLRKNNDAAQVATEMIQNGEINPEMSSSEIRKAVKARRGKSSKKDSNYSANDDSSVDETNGEENNVDENEIAKTLERQNQITKINEVFKTSYDAVKELTGDNTDMVVMLSAQREMSKLASSVETNSAASVDSEIEQLKRQLAEMQAENDRLRAENTAYDKTAQAQAKTIENLMAENHGLQITIEGLKQGVDSKEKQIEELSAENDKLKENVEVEESIGEEKVISKGGKIIAIVNDKLGITFKYTKNNNHVYYQGGKQIKSEVAKELIAQAYIINVEG